MERSGILRVGLAFILDQVTDTYVVEVCFSIRGQRCFLLYLLFKYKGNLKDIKCDRCSLEPGHVSAKTPQHLTCYLPSTKSPDVLPNENSIIPEPVI